MENTGAIFPKESRRESALLSSLLERAVEKVRNRFEAVDLLNADDVLPYHNTRHTKSVMGRAAKIASRMKGLGDQAELAVVGAAFHDVVRTWTERIDFASLAVRKTNPYIDEVASAREAMLEMVACGYGDPADHILVMSSIVATTVTFGVVPGSVHQPLLNHFSHPVVRAVALADLNAAAMAGTPDQVECAARDGDLLFREHELGIARTFARIEAREELTAPERGEFHRRMMMSLEDQLSFLINRMERLPGELGPHQAELARVINVDNIQLVINRVHAFMRERARMNFWELAQDMGYSVPAL